MSNTGKCPYCEQRLSSVDIEHIDINENLKRKFRGLSLVCPSCNKVINVSMNPLALRNELIEQLVERLKK